jgi:hypothetical protein
MPDHRLQIVPCENDDFACSSFVCREMHTKKYFVGNPYSGTIYLYPVFCEDCIFNLLSHIPSELSPDGGALENRLRAEISLEYSQKTKEMLAQQEKWIRAEVTAQLIEQFAKPEVHEVPPVEDVAPEEESLIAVRNSAAQICLKRTTARMLKQRPNGAAKRSHDSLLRGFRVMGADGNCITSKGARPRKRTYGTAEIVPCSQPK